MMVVMMVTMTSGLTSDLMRMRSASRYLYAPDFVDSGIFGLSCVGCGLGFLLQTQPNPDWQSGLRRADRDSRHTIARGFQFLDHFLGRGFHFLGPLLLVVVRLVPVRLSFLVVIDSCPWSHF